MKILHKIPFIFASIIMPLVITASLIPDSNQKLESKNTNQNNSEEQNATLFQKPNENIQSKEQLSYCPEPQFLQKSANGLRKESCWKDQYGRNWENASVINSKNHSLPIFDTAFTSDFSYSENSIFVICIYKYKNESKTNGLEDRITLSSYFKLIKQPSDYKWGEAGKDGSKQCPNDDDLLDEASINIKDCPFEVSSDKVIVDPGFSDPTIDAGCVK